MISTLARYKMDQQVLIETAYAAGIYISRRRLISTKEEACTLMCNLVALRLWQRRKRK